MKTKNLALLLFLSSFFYLLSCSSNEERKKIKIDGSSTVYPISEAVAEEYRSEATDVDVTVGVSGTGGGFKKFARKEISISDASRPIKESEINKCLENNVSYVELTVAYDGLAVIVHKDNDWVDYFTVEELNKIWHPDAQDNIKYWNQIRDGWPNQKIGLYGPGTASGTYDYFAEAVCGKKVGTRGDYNASEDDHVLVQGVSGDKGGLGFFGLAYYEASKSKLKLVPVVNPKMNEPIYPTEQTVSDGSYFPLSRPIFIYVSNLAKSQDHIKDFVNFYLDNAGELSKDVGYIPLLDSEYEAEKKEFKEFLSK